MARWDVAVVGGGPAGATAARELARRGARAVLIDRAVFPRYKTCGGGLVGRVARLLSEQLEGVVERDCHEAELVERAAGSSFLLEHALPLVRMTMRDRLDAALVEAAVAAGVELRDGCAVRNVEAGAEEVRLETSHGAVSARWLVAADGATGRVAPCCGFGALPRVAPAIEWELRVGDHDLERFAGRARFDLGFPEGGYAWVFPKREHLSVGAGVLFPSAGRRAGLREALDAYVADLGLQPRSDEGRHGFLIPIRPRREGCARGRVLLAGDAAGLADPVTAEGITHAVLSGRLVARALTDERWRTPSDVARLYRRLLDREILRELRCGRLLARILYARSGVRRRLFERHGPALVRAMGQVIAGERRYGETIASPSNWLRLLRPERSARGSGPPRGGRWRSRPWRRGRER